MVKASVDIHNINCLKWSFSSNHWRDYFLKFRLGIQCKTVNSNYQRYTRVLTNISNFLRICEFNQAFEVRHSFFLPVKSVLGLRDLSVSDTASILIKPKSRTPAMLLDSFPANLLFKAIDSNGHLCSLYQLTLSDAKLSVERLRTAREIVEIHILKIFPLPGIRSQRQNLSKNFRSGTFAKLKYPS